MLFLTRIFPVVRRIFDGTKSETHYLDPLVVSYFHPELFWLFSSMVFPVAADFFLSSKKHIINIRTVSSYSYCTANVYRGLQGLYREIRVRGFQNYGDCLLPKIPVILKSPYFYFHCNICKQFDLQGYHGDTPN